jgi:glucokinase
MSDKPQIILAGDIGGTKSNLAILSVNSATLGMERNRRFPSGDYPSLNAIIREFLRYENGQLLAACFGVPGPVKEGRVRTTNLSWGVDAAEIEKEFSIPQVSILNDLEANAYGIAELSPQDFAVIQQGSAEPQGNRCVVSPGTGLGEGGLYWDSLRKKYRVWACEGGHTDFAARNELEIALLEYLIAQYGHVSAERVVSGMGIGNIYKFLRDTGRGRERPQVASEMEKSGAGFAISRYADSGECQMCVQTIELFVSALGAEAGNMALKTMATGGVYLGGGIPGKIFNEARCKVFIRSFNDKGRLSGLMQTMPVKIVLNDQAALLGAASYALDRINTSSESTPDELQTRPGAPSPGR